MLSKLTLVALAISAVQAQQFLPQQVGTQVVGSQTQFIPQGASTTSYIQPQATQYATQPIQYATQPTVQYAAQPQYIQQPQIQYVQAAPQQVVQTVAAPQQPTADALYVGVTYTAAVAGQVVTLRVSGRSTGQETGTLASTTGLTAEQVAAQIAAAQAAASAAAPVPASTTPTVDANIFLPSSGACRLLETTDVNADACTARWYLLRQGTAQLAAFTGDALNDEATGCAKISKKAAVLAPLSRAKLLALNKIAACKTAGIKVAA